MASSSMVLSEKNLHCWMDSSSQLGFELIEHQLNRVELWGVWRVSQAHDFSLFEVVHS